MLPLKTGATLTLVLFSILTAVAIIVDGTNGFAAAIAHSQMTLQIWLDLVIAAIFCCGWAVRDSRTDGRSPWLWVIGTLLFGALVPLIYTIRYGKWPASVVRGKPSSDATRRRILCAVVLALFAAQTVHALLANGGSPWGWALFALVAGSFSPLLYLLMYGHWPASHPIEHTTA